jgi:hypothetical protein
MMNEFQHDLAVYAFKLELRSFSAESDSHEREQAL